MKYLFVSFIAVVAFTAVNTTVSASTRNHDSVIMIAQMQPEDMVQYEEGTVTGEDIFGDYSPEEEIPIDQLTNEELKEMGFSDEEIKELRSSEHPASE